MCRDSTAPWWIIGSRHVPRLVLSVHLGADVLAVRSPWHLLLLALGAGLANAFSSSGPAVVTNMVTGHWNALATFAVDVVASGVDLRRRRAAQRSLGITLLLVLGVIASTTLIRHGVALRPVGAGSAHGSRFWWFGAAYASLFLWHDLAQPVAEKWSGEGG